MSRPWTYSFNWVFWKMLCFKFVTLKNTIQKMLGRLQKVFLFQSKQMKQARETCWINGDGPFNICVGWACGLEAGRILLWSPSGWDSLGKLIVGLSANKTLKLMAPGTGVCKRIGGCKWARRMRNRRRAAATAGGRATWYFTAGGWIGSDHASAIRCRREGARRAETTDPE